MKSILLLLTLICSTVLVAQNDKILIAKFKNPSFEDPLKRKNRRVKNKYHIEDQYIQEDSINHWKNEGYWFESPPDLHVNGRVLHRVIQKASHGEKYVGLVTRNNDTYEAISQRLPVKLEKYYEYLFYITVSTFNGYVMVRPLSDTDGQVTLSDRPIVLVISGRLANANREWEELYVSDKIDHEEWRRYEISIMPMQDIDEIRISAYWDLPSMFSYFGNILIDDISPIYRIE